MNNQSKNNRSNPSPEEKNEGQLSVRLDDVERKPPIPAAEYIANLHKANLAKKPLDGNAENRGNAPIKSNVTKNPPFGDKNAAAQHVSPKLNNEASADSSKQVNYPRQNAANNNAKLPQNPVNANNPAPKLSDMEVMKHTETLWHYMEIVDNGTEMHSETHQKYAKNNALEIFGARVRGKKHKHEGTNCDDFFETVLTDDFAVAIVCDGAGSKPLSRIGSRVSGETAAAYLKETLTELFADAPSIKGGLSADTGSNEFMTAAGQIATPIRESARKAFAAQQEELARISADDTYKKALGRLPQISDLSTTFLAAVLIPLIVDGKRETFLACVQIGDGCICAINSEADSEHCLKLMGEADSGAFSGETDFLSEKNTKTEIIGTKTRISRGCSDTILLMSDGVADDYFPANPMMERLYLDLSLNGILPMEGEITHCENPAPIRFNSVSMTQQSVELQYAKQLISDDSEKTMRGLWDKRAMLKCHSLEAFKVNIGDTPEERLCVWLDNYNERGSFDDRSLICVRINKNV